MNKTSRWTKAESLSKDKRAARLIFDRYQLDASKKEKQSIFDVKYPSLDSRNLVRSKVYQSHSEPRYRESFKGLPGQAPHTVPQINRTTTQHLMRRRINKNGPDGLKKPLQWWMLSLHAEEGYHLDKFIEDTLLKCCHISHKRY